MVNGNATVLLNSGAGRATARLLCRLAMPNPNEDIRLRQQHESSTCLSHIESWGNKSGFGNRVSPSNPETQGRRGTTNLAGCSILEKHANVSVLRFIY